MDLEQVVQYLENRLAEPMPGVEASKKMLPLLASGDRIRLKHEENAREGGVMILLYPDHGTVRFPLIQRPIYTGVHSGQMALPGGKRDEEDSDLIQTALRETEEEIGVPKDTIEVIGSLSSFYVAVSNFQILPVIGWMPSVPTFIPQESEVADIVSADLSHLIDDNYQKEKEMIVTGGAKLRSPYFDLENRTVWGATSMMLNEFKVILKEAF